MRKRPPVRGWQRHPIALDLRFGLPGRRRDDAVTREISIGGLSYYCRHDLAPGARLELEVDLPGEPEALRLDAFVIWVKQRETDEGEPFNLVGLWLPNPPMAWRQLCREVDAMVTLAATRPVRMRLRMS